MSIVFNMLLWTFVLISATLILFSWGCFDNITRKYRIIKEETYYGSHYYIVKKRYMLFFWKCPIYDEWGRPKQFRTFNEAKHYVNYQMKNKKGELVYEL